MSTDPEQWAKLTAYYGHRISRVDHLAHEWPVRVRLSPTRDLRAIEGPPAGTQQMSLVCWQVKNGVPCDQSVALLAQGVKFYKLTPEGILQGIRAHIEQCHSDKLAEDNSGDSRD